MQDEKSTHDLPLGRHLHVASRLYFSALSTRLKETEIDRYYAVLTCIDLEGGQISQQEVGRRLMIDKASMVKIIDYLSKKDFVQRITNLNDRRSYHLVITSRAKEILPMIYRAMNQLNMEAFEGFSKDQVKLFREMLCSVSATLKNKSVQTNIFVQSEPKKV